MRLNKTNEEHILSFRNFESRTVRKDKFDNINMKQSAMMCSIVRSPAMRPDYS